MSMHIAKIEYNQRLKEPAYDPVGDQAFSSLLVWLAEYDEEAMIELMAKIGYWHDCWIDTWTKELARVMENINAKRGW